MLSSFDTFYVRGGNVFILRRAFHQSGADQVTKELLATDAIVYAGYSAGPCILGPTLRGLDGPEDDPYATPLGYDAPVIWDGLNVLPYAILPHFESGNAEIEKARNYYVENHIPFLALRDGEALVVEGNSRRVVG